MQRKVLRSVYYPVQQRLPLRDAVVFISWKGKQCGDNPRGHRRGTAPPRRHPGAHLGGQRLVGAGPARRHRGPGRHRGLLRGAGPQPVPDRQRRHAVVARQAGGPGLRADLARHAAEADRLRHQPAPVHQRDPVPGAPEAGGGEVGPAAVAQPVQHADHAPGVPLRRRDLRVRLPPQRRAVQRRRRADRRAGAGAAGHPGGQAGGPVRADLAGRPVLRLGPVPVRLPAGPGAGLAPARRRLRHPAPRASPHGRRRPARHPARLRAERDRLSQTWPSCSWSATR